MDALADLFDWLVDGAPGVTGSPDIVTRLGDSLRAAGLPVDRVAIFVLTLHPNVLGRAFYWRPGEPVTTTELTLTRQSSADFVGSPVHTVFTTREELRLRVSADSHYSLIRTLHADGFADFLGLPLIFTTGSVHAITFATRRLDGFADADLAAMRRIARPLARVAEIFALRRTAANILSTYVGHDSGERILAGRIHKGDIEVLRAVIWFSDLRGFSTMSQGRSPRELIDTLNELFEGQVPAIEARGGEVLKFIGDGLLAIFPCAGPEATARACDAALAAADAALAALAAAGHGLQIGVGLHVGEIAYGNIGGASRLDFTVIGEAVNLASRIEGLTARLGRRVVVSADFAAHATRPLDALGEFELKGIAARQPVFGPRE